MRGNNFNELEVETLDGQQLQAKSTQFQKKKGTANIKTNALNGNKKLIIKFKLTINSQEIFFILKGNKAKTLKCLIESNGNGCTALEISGTFALRLSEYVRALRTDNLAGGRNLEILMIKESNPANWHGRYILKSCVEIVKIF
jgi:hypothetical protein